MSHYEYEGRDPGYGVDTSWHHQEPGSHIDADISGYTHSNAEYDDPIEIYANTMEEFKIAAEGHAQNLQNSVLAIKHKTDHIRNELDSVQNLFGSIRSITRDKSRPREHPYGQTSSSYSRSRYNPMQSKHMASALDSKLERYKQSAEDRKSQTRSGSTNATGRYQADAKNYKSLKDKVHMLEKGFNNI